MNDRILRIALVIGAVIDGGIAIVCLFFQPLSGPLTDIPVKDPAFATFAGGEFLVVALLYLLILRNLERYRLLLWIVALDQVLAIVLPAQEIARGNIVATWKTIGPMPLSALLAAAYVWGAVKHHMTDASQPPRLSPTESTRASSMDGW
jgi:hypothetical protein